MNISTIIDACDRKCRSVGLSGLTPKERLVVLASWANAEVELGGLAAFFHNATKHHTREILAALIELGAMDEAAAINQGRQLMRRHSWEHLASSAQLDRLTDKFLAATPGVIPRLAAFVEHNFDELAAVVDHEAAAQIPDRKAQRS